MQKDVHDWLDTDEKRFHKKPRTMSVRSRLPKLGLILLVATITAAITIQTAYGCGGNGNNGDDNNSGGKDGKDSKDVAASTKLANGTAAITLVNQKATLSRFSLSNGPLDTPLIIHIHAQNTKSTKPEEKCKGPVLFVIKNPEGGDPIIKTDGNGKFSLKKQAFELAPPTPPAPGTPPTPPPRFKQD